MKLGILGQYVKEKRRLKEIEMEAYSIEKDVVKEKKKQKKMSKKARRETGAASRGRAKAQAGGEVKYAAKKVKKTAGRAFGKAADIGERYMELQQKGVIGYTSPFAGTGVKKSKKRR